MCCIAGSTCLLLFCATLQVKFAAQRQQFLSGCSGRRINISVSGTGSEDPLDSWAPAVLWCCPLGRALLSLRAVLPFCWYCPGSQSQGACPLGSQSARTVPRCAERSWPNPIVCSCLLCPSPWVCKWLLQGSPLLRNIPLCPTELHLQPQFRDKSAEKFKTAAGEGWPSFGSLEYRAEWPHSQASSEHWALSWKETGS